MTQHSSNPIDALSDAQLERLFALRDGELAPADALAAQQEIDASPALKAAAAQLGIIEKQTAQAYEPTRMEHDAAQHAAVAHRGAAPSKRAFSPRVMGFAIAAILALTATLIIINRPAPLPSVSISAVHAAMVQNDTPEIVCDTHEKFVAYTTKSLGEAISAKFGTGIALIGWRGAGEYDPNDHLRRRVLLARSTSGDPIVVLFQPSAAAAPTQTNHALHMYSKKLGNITAWEVSKLSEPQVLGLLTQN
jgi:hypothetical protein